MATPVAAQIIKRGISFLLIVAEDGFNKYNIQNNTTLTTTLTAFKPNGFIKAGLTNFTILKLAAKIKFADSTAK